MKKRRRDGIFARFFREVWFNIKSFFQKIFRGYSNDELWNLDNTIAKWILPRLKAFKKDSIAFPADLDSPDEWDEILDKMIWSFDYITNQDEYEDEIIEKYKDNEFDEDGHYRWIKDAKELSEKCQEGLDLFAKYFRSLWW